jgi:hypothetical protein
MERITNLAAKRIPALNERNLSLRIREWLKTAPGFRAWRWGTGWAHFRGSSISIDQIAAGRMYMDARKLPLMSQASGVRNQYPLVS